MVDAGAFFYDRKEVFQTYLERRKSKTSANDTLELPIVRQLLPALKGKSLLDIGCGDAAIAAQLFTEGLISYHGFDGSANMVELAQKHLPDAARVEQAFIENFDYPPEPTYDIALSRLAFHYVEMIQPVFELIHRALLPGGWLVFSVEHPVITSHQVGTRTSAKGASWVVDRYFEPGKREIPWLGGEVLKYHRTVEHYFRSLKAAGFTVQELRESEPDPDLIRDKSLLRKRSRYPLFLFFAVQK